MNIPTLKSGGNTRRMERSDRLAPVRERFEVEKIKSLEISTLFTFFVYFEPFEERKDYSSARDINKLLANFRYCHSYISAVTTTCWSNLCFSVPPLVIVRSESLS